MIKQFEGYRQLSTCQSDEQWTEMIITPNYVLRVIA